MNKLATLSLKTQWLIPALLVGIVGAGCSSMGSKTGQDMSPTGPTVVNAKSNPTTIELNQSFQPQSPASVTAEVKDFSSKVTDVRLRFVRVPMEIRMENVGGTTWKAELTPQQIRTLAVGGETMSYEANVVARNKEGMVAVSPTPVEITVKTPELTSPKVG